MREVIVIGGGISGLAAAWRLKQAGRDVVVLEAAATPGGNIKSAQVDGFRLDMGPQSFLASSDALWDLIEEAGLAGKVQSSRAPAGKRYVFRGGLLRALPMSPPSFVTSKLLSARGKLRLMAEPLVRGGAKDDDTAWDFFVRRFGEEAATYMMGPFVSGIYAGDAKQLGARAAFPKFHNFEREHGSMILGAIKFKLAQKRAGKSHGGRRGLFSFDGGLGGLTRALAERLPDVRYGVQVQSISRRGNTLRVHGDGELIEARAVISAVPPKAASDLISQIAPDVTDLLSAIPMAPVVVAHWSQPESGSLPNGFGFLMPRYYGFNVLGTVFASELFAERAPAGQRLFASFYGGVTNPAFLDKSDSEIAQVVIREHAGIFRTQLDNPQLMYVTRYPGAIPQLLPDHPERIEQVHASADRVPGLFLAGNYLTGVGIDHAVSSGFAAADSVQQFLQASAVGRREVA